MHEMFAECACLGRIYNDMFVIEALCVGQYIIYIKWIRAVPCSQLHLCPKESAAVSQI